MSEQYDENPPIEVEETVEEPAVVDEDVAVDPVDAVDQSESSEPHRRPVDVDRRGRPGRREVAEDNPVAEVPTRPSRGRPTRPPTR